MALCLINPVLVVLAVSLLTVTVSKTRELAVDLGRNVTLPCPLPGPIIWNQEGIDGNETSPYIPEDDGSLILYKLNPSDAGVYNCWQKGAEDLKFSINLRVRTPPPSLNLKIHSSTILALVLWSVKGTGGYPIIYFTAEYRLADGDEEWLPISPNRIAPNVRQMEVYKLEPNTTYAFRIWATNRLGPGEIAEAEGHTRHNDQDLELRRFFITSVQVFDRQMLVIAVIVILVSIVFLSLGTCILFCQEGSCSGGPVQEVMPHIILNPGFIGTVDAFHSAGDDESTPWLRTTTTKQPGLFQTQ